MANFFTDVGRSGALPKAANNLLDRARQMRSDRVAGEQRAEDVDFRERELALKQDVAQSNIDASRVQTNIDQVKLQELRAQQERDNRVIPLEQIQSAYKSQAQAASDYDIMRRAGRITTLDDGTEVIMGRDARWFRENVANTPQYHQDFNSRLRITFENLKNTLSADVNKAKAKLDEQVAAGREPNKNDVVKFEGMREQLREVVFNYSDALSRDVSYMEMDQQLALKFTSDSIAKWKRGAGRLEPRPKGGGVGGGLEATDERAISAAVDKTFGGVLNAVTGEFSGMEGTAKERASVRARATRILIDNPTLSREEAANQAAEEIGVDLRNLTKEQKFRKGGYFSASRDGTFSPHQRQQAIKILKEAGGDKDKARALAKKKGIVF